MSVAFASVDGADGKGGSVAFPGVLGTGGPLMLTQTMTPAGVGARINPVLVGLEAVEGVTSMMLCVRCT